MYLFGSKQRDDAVLRFLLSVIIICVFLEVAVNVGRWWGLW